jgi:hypothetical protein
MAGNSTEWIKRAESEEQTANKREQGSSVVKGFKVVQRIVELRNK